MSETHLLIFKKTVTKLLPAVVMTVFQILPFPEVLFFVMYYELLSTVKSLKQLA